MSSIDDATAPPLSLSGALATTAIGRVGQGIGNAILSGSNSAINGNLLLDVAIDTGKMEEKKLKLNISPRVEKYLVENGLVDNRKIWCYAHTKAVIKLQKDLVKRYGLTLVCIHQDALFLYRTKVNSTELELIYACELSEMQNVRVRKIFFGLRRVLSFSKGEECFRLEMDEWKRFSEIFDMY